MGKDRCVHKHAAEVRAGRFHVNEYSSNLGQGPLGVVNDSKLPVYRPEFERLGAHGPERPSGKMHAGIDADHMVCPGVSASDEVGSVRSRRQLGGYSNFGNGMQLRKGAAAPMREEWPQDNSSQMSSALKGVPPPPLSMRPARSAEDSSQVVSALRGIPPADHARKQRLAPVSENVERPMFDLLTHGRSVLRTAGTNVTKGIRTFEHGPLASNVDSLVLDHDIDGSDARKAYSRNDCGGGGIKTFGPVPQSNVADTVVYVVDSNDGRRVPHKVAAGRGIKTF